MCVRRYGAAKFRTRFKLGGNLYKIVDVEDMPKHAPTGGVWGHAPPPKFHKYEYSKTESGAFLEVHVFLHISRYHIHKYFRLKRLFNCVLQ